MSTTTETIVITTPLEEVEKIELFDVEFARQLKSEVSLPKEERDKIRRYLKRCENINSVKVVYKLGKALRNSGHPLGRLCASEGIGLQTFSRDVRSALGGRYYWDVDVVNAQPTLLVQYCKREGLECKALQRYTESREEVLEEIVTSLGIERWEAKEKVLSLLYGGSSEGLTPFLCRDLAPELRRILQNVWTRENERLKWLKGHPNYMGKGMAFHLQTEERRVLLSLDKALARRGRSLDVLIHDGGLVRKKDGETEFPSRVLRELEDDIEKETGYRIRLVVKPLETTIEREGDADSEYTDRKRLFEDDGWKGSITFKLRYPPIFVSLSDGRIEQMSRSDLLQNEEDNVLSDGTEFIKRWLVDPSKREYRRLVFLPKLDPPNGCYNLFRGFPVEPKKGNFGAFHRVLELVSNFDAIVFKYIEDWASWMVQFPHRKTKVCIVVSGEEGVGKDTYFDGLGKIFGEYFFNTSSPEDNVFSKFNSAIARVILLKFEEANFQTNKANADALKSLITSERTNIEKKGRDVIELDSYVNTVMTTNHDVPVVLSDTDRRFVLIRASSARRGDHAFWKEIHTELSNPDTIAAYHHYLLNRNIEGFCPFSDRPRTQYYDDVKQSFIPYHARYFQRLIEEDPDREEEIEWNARTLYNSMKEATPKLEINETRFGRDLRSYIDAGALTKRKASINLYVGSFKSLRTFLEGKGWWIDF